MFDLSGKRALVTGASGGLGGAIATQLHKQGAHVVLSGTRQEALDSLASQLGERASVHVCKLDDPAGIEAMVAGIEEQGGLDILINNAGLTKDTLLIRMKDEDWESVMTINLLATFRLTRAAMKGMMKRRSGRVISIASIVGVMGNAGQSNYAASKAGMIGFTKSVAQEVASRNVTLNVIAPGFIQTAMTDVLNEDQKNAMMSRIPMGRFGSGDDIAATAVFLASNEASYITGQTFHVNGGMIMI